MKRICFAPCDVRESFQRLTLCYALGQNPEKETALAALPERKPMEAKPVGTGDSDLYKMSWDELDKADRLLELKTKYPEIYQQKFNEKFNKKH